MNPRTQIVEMFSTFVKFNPHGCFLNWISHAKLQRSMKTSWEQYTPANNSPEFWGIYWYEFWRDCSSNLAKDHLYAYLQEPCYQAAEKFWYKYQNKFPDYQIEEYFQIAIANVDRLLPKVNPNIFSIRNYAKTIFVNAITDRMRCVNKSIGHTNWSLLANTSEKAFKNALKNHGCMTVSIDTYLLAWDCFKEIYAANHTQTKQKLSAPNSETWQQIARLYERLRQPTDPEVNATAIAQWMQFSADAIRKYLAPPMTSLNRAISADDSRELQEVLPSNDKEGIEQIINRDTTAQINTVLINVLQEIAQESRQVPSTKTTKTAEEVLKILPLFYKQGLSQTEIGKLLNIEQFTVSRRMKSVKQKMLNSLAKWAKSTLHISIDSHILNYMNELVEEWLDRYFTN